jgi:hypothetical protein
MRLENPVGTKQGVTQEHNGHLQISSMGTIGAFYRSLNATTVCSSDSRGHSRACLSFLNIRRSVWRTHLNQETKTHEDDDDAGVVSIIEPLRRINAIKPETTSGCMFPNTIGGALDIDNLADRVIKPVLEVNGLKWKGWYAIALGWPRTNFAPRFGFAYELASNTETNVRPTFGC